MLNKKSFSAAAGLILIGFASGAAAQPLFGPKGTFSSMFSSLSYDPSTACSKPYRPYSNDSQSWEIYKSEADTYLRCLKRAANSDMDYAGQVVQAGYDDAVEDFMNEVRSGY